MNSKKNLIKVFVCGAAVLSMGVTAFAATQNSRAVATFDFKTNEATENAGYMIYEGSEDSSVTGSQKEGTPTISEQGVMVTNNMETGEVTYSNDGSNTWKLALPDEHK